MSDEDSLLTNLCAICHINPPKYRCPRCSTRTCSLPCTKRHKQWSQCSGVRDPAAYLRRNELASESAFDRDFNFITGIERRIERAGREAENRGVDVEKRGVSDLGVVGLEDEQEHEQDDRKRKRGGNAQRNGNGPEKGLAKGEAGFLRRAQEAGVKVIKAPKGMSRAKMNGSKWNPKQKCLQWSVEWVADGSTKRVNCAETLTLSEAYDRAFPFTKEEKELRAQDTSTTISENESKTDARPADEEPHQSTLPTQASTQQDSMAETTDNQPERNTSELPPQSTETPNQQNTNTSSSSESQIHPYRNAFFYLHRPRTATKQPVISPVNSNAKLSDTLRNRTVLEFPTIYVLQSPLEDQPGESRFISEKEYLQTHQDSNPDEGGEDIDADSNAQPLFGEVDIPEVDEGKMLEVLEKDLLGAAPA
ncbi:hypothetical protein BDV18DRAFT_88111 [Aspergillus unguis]